MMQDDKKEKRGKLSLFHRSSGGGGCRRASTLSEAALGARKCRLARAGMKKRRSPAPRQQWQEQQRKSRHRAPRARNSNQGGAVEASILRSLINGLSADAELESKNCLPSLFPSQCCEREFRCSGAPKTWEFPSQKRRERASEPEQLLLFVLEREPAAAVEASSSKNASS